MGIYAVRPGMANEFVLLPVSAYIRLAALRSGHIDEGVQRILVPKSGKF